MAHEIVKYHNEMNSIPFNGFNHKDYNIFYAIVSRMRDQKTKSITFNYKYLMKLSGIHYHGHLSNFNRDLSNTFRKMLRVGYSYNNAHHEGTWLLFNKFDINKDDHTVTIKVNPDLVGVLNHLVSNFTRFSLMRFTSIKSPYAQTIYRLIEEFRQTGLLILPMNKFRRLLDVPKSYDADLIRRHVLTPIEIELTPLVRGLHVIIDRHGRGGKVIGYKFAFKPQSAKYDYMSHGYDQDTKIMFNNIDKNSFISTEISRKAITNLAKVRTPKPPKKKVKREPMGAFNNMLKVAPLGQLKWYMHLHRERSPLINLSEYQMRKLRKTIKMRESNKNFKE